jgi:hypothetical protein
MVNINVKFEVIDRNTGEVKLVQSHNAIHYNTARAIIQAIRDGTSVQFNNYDKIYVTDTSAGITKYLDATKTYTDLSTSQTIRFTASDTSTDAYTVRVAGIKSSSPANSATEYLAVVQTNVSKGASDILNVTWEITISCLAL